MSWEQARQGAGIAAAAVGAWWLGLGTVLQVLLVLMALDIVSGMAAAFANKTLDSAVGWRGVMKKALTLAVVAVAAQIEPLLAAGLGGANVPLGQAVGLYFVAIEALSCVENAAEAGVPIPGILREALIKLKAIGGDEPPPPPAPAATG